MRPPLTATPAKTRLFAGVAVRGGGHFLACHALLCEIVSLHSIVFQLSSVLHPIVFFLVTHVNFTVVMSLPFSPCVRPRMSMPLFIS